MRRVGATPPKDDAGGEGHQERTVMVRADSITPPPGREARKSGPSGGREWTPFVFQNLEAFFEGRPIENQVDYAAEMAAQTK